MKVHPTRVSRAMATAAAYSPRRDENSHNRPSASVQTIITVVLFSAVCLAQADGDHKPAPPMQFVRPAGWEQVASASGGITLSSPDRLAKIILTQTARRSGTCREAFDSFVRAEAGASRNSPSNGPVETLASRNGHEVLNQAIRVELRGKILLSWFWLGCGPDRSEGVIYQTGTTEAWEKYQNAFEEFLSTWRIGGGAGPTGVDIPPPPIIQALTGEWGTGANYGTNSTFLWYLFRPDGTYRWTIRNMALRVYSGLTGSAWNEGTYRVTGDRMVLDIKLTSEQGQMASPDQLKRMPTQSTKHIGFRVEGDRLLISDPIGTTPEAYRRIAPGGQR
jgi:hypothetical protein